MARNIDFRVGYEGLQLYGVALAPDQSQAQDLFVGFGDPVTGDLYVGGLYFGGNFSF